MKGVDYMNTIRLSEIIVPESFKNNKPSDEKMNKVRAYVDEHKKLDKPIVLDGNMLTDNYVRYLVAVECGFKKVPYVTTQEYRDREADPNKPMTYIIGKFDGNEKEYIWKVTKNISFEVGDKAMVKSRGKHSNDGAAVITVVNVFTSDSDKMLRHKPVIKKVKRK